MNKDTHILYICHVDWNWIKQRPQYMAEELAHSYPLTFMQGHAYRKRGLKDNETGDITIREFSRVPTLNESIAPLVAHNDRVARSVVSDEAKKYPSTIAWLTGPKSFKWLPRDYGGKVVYDCMDDHDAFYTGEKKEAYERLERGIVDRADLIFASSLRLVDKMRRMDETGSKPVVLVRNGFDGQVIDLSHQPEAADGRTDGTLKACYFGTIGPWFDFDVIQASLERFPRLSYKIIGPVGDGVEPLHHDRIEYTGPVAHDSLGEYVADCDCFLMPFQVNDIVLSVDPVKMYEYVNFGKDIICVRYPEVERFGDYAELYNGANEYCKAIEAVMARKRRKYSDAQRLELLQKSSWHSRMKPVLKALSEL